MKNLDHRPNLITCNFTDETIKELSYLLKNLGALKESNLSIIVVNSRLSEPKRTGLQEGLSNTFKEEEDFKTSPIQSGCIYFCKGEDTWKDSHFPKVREMTNQRVIVLGDPCYLKNSAVFSEEFHDGCHIILTTESHENSIQINRGQNFGMDIILDLEDVPSYVRKLLKFQKPPADLATLLERKKVNYKGKSGLVQKALTDLGQDSTLFDEDLILKKILLEGIDVGEKDGTLDERRSENVSSGYFDKVQQAFLNGSRIFQSEKLREKFREELLPQLFNSVSFKKTLKVWIPGGIAKEDIYTLALYLFAYGEKFFPEFTINIFVTDYSMATLMYFRKNKFSEKEFSHLSQDEKENYFYKDGKILQIINSVRSLLKFNIHDYVFDYPLVNADFAILGGAITFLKKDQKNHFFENLLYALNNQGIVHLENIKDFQDFGEFYVPLSNFENFLKKNSNVSNF